jgi:hypothetical protein
MATRVLRLVNFDIGLISSISAGSDEQSSGVIICYGHQQQFVVKSAMLRKSKRAEQSGHQTGGAGTVVQYA